MKTVIKFLVAMFLITMGTEANAQDQVKIDSLKIAPKRASVENSVWGIQLGTLGIWAHHEYGLAERFSLRNEVGFNFGFGFSNFGISYGYIVATPSIVFEPRWYYFLNEESYFTKNSGSFLALKVDFLLPPRITLVTSGDKSIALINPNVLAISFIPKWGIRKTVWGHLTYEIGVGIGYQVIFNFMDINPISAIGFDVHLRIGYTF